MSTPIDPVLLPINENLEVELPADASVVLNQARLLQKVKPEKVYGASLMRVATSFDFLYENEKVTALAQIFQQNPDLMAVGICDQKERALGVVTRMHLFSLLGKPFGVDVLSKKPVREVIEDVPRFDMHTNLFQAAEQLQEQIDRSIILHYLLTNRDGAFMGIFSSKDLLSYLSKITQEDIALAGQLQERLVKSRQSLADEHWAAEAFSHSAKGLGGDFYHIQPLEDGRVFVALGDVSGKGAAASILTSLLWGVLQFFDFRKGLKRLLHQINEALIRTFHLEKYLTGVFMIYDPVSRELTLADMGHGHSWMIRSGKPKQLRFPQMNLPLGIDLSLSPQIYKARLHPNDLLIFYTDGLTEQENEKGEEFGEDAVLTTVVTGFAAVNEIPETIQEKLMRHQGAVPRLDDVTWLQLLVK